MDGILESISLSPRVCTGVLEVESVYELLYLCSSYGDRCEMDVLVMSLDNQNHQILFEKMMASFVCRGIPGWPPQVGRGSPRLTRRRRGVRLPRHTIGSFGVSCRSGNSKVTVLIVSVRIKNFNHGMEINLASSDDSLRDRPLDRVCSLPIPLSGTAVWGRCSVGAGLRAAGRGERAAGS